MRAKRKSLFILVLIIIIAVAALVIMRSVGADKTENTPERSSENSSQKISTSAVTESDKSTSDVSVSETQTNPSASSATTKKNAMDDLVGTYYYLFDNENIYCYVFSFDNKGNVDIAFFNDENIYEGDPKFFDGYSTYKFSNNEIVMDSLADALPDQSIKLTIKKNELYYGDTKLESDKELSLNKVNAHFV